MAELKKYSIVVIYLIVAATQIQGACLPCPDLSIITEFSTCQNCSEGLFYDFETKECVSFTECGIMKKLSTTKLDVVLSELVSKYYESVGESPTNEFLAKDWKIIKQLLKKHTLNYIEELQPLFLGTAMSIFMQNQNEMKDCNSNMVCLGVKVVTNPLFIKQINLKWNIIEGKFFVHLKLLFDDLELASVNCLSDQQCPILMNVYKIRRALPDILLHSWDLIMAILTEMEAVEEDLYENNNRKQEKESTTT